MERETKTIHRFPPTPEYRKAVIIRVTEKRGIYLGRWETPKECIFGEAVRDADEVAASAYTAFLKSRNIEL